MSEPEFVRKADPEEVFAALSDDTRVAILRALWDAEGDTLPFSALREAVGIRDSGQFNYHLGKLAGQFVTQTDDGYKLARAGIQINGAIEAGAYTMEASLEPIELDSPCPTCDSDRTLYYEDDTVRVECASCTASARFGVPPSVLAGHDRDTIPSVAGRYMRSTFERITDGFCSFCDGAVDPTVGPMDEFIEAPEELPDDVPDEFLERVQNLPFVQYDCEQCGATPSGNLRAVFLSHPAVVSFHYDRGIDVRDLSIWDVAGFDPESETICQRDPFRASATFTVDDDSLTLVVDDHLDVVEIERDRNA